MFDRELIDALDAANSDADFGQGGEGGYDGNGEFAYFNDEQTE